MSNEHDHDDLLEPLIRLPERGDRAFNADGKMHETACIVTNGWWGHAVSYKETADIVVQHALNDRGSLDFVILPVCFLYRHYLELSLKALASEVAMLTKTPPPKYNHDLKNQWEYVRGFFARAKHENQVEEAIRATDDLLQEWAQYDGQSYAFRYPTSMNGEASLPSSFRHLNIRRLAETIDKIDALFTGMASYLDTALDHTSLEG